MGRSLLISVLCATSLFAQAQQPAASDDTVQKPLPPIRELLLDVERNEKASEAMRRDYTYHVHIDTQELDGKGNVKKTTVTDSESVTIDGVRIDRTIAKDGKPLTPEEAKKEGERIDKEVAKAKEKRAKLDARGEASDTRGDEVLSASRILELGAFTNPRRVDLNGRPTIVFDYAGDPNAKKRNQFEGIVRDLVGTVWVDEQDHVLARAEGHFLNDFKIGGGLVLNIHKGFSFAASFTKINAEAWLPTAIEGQGSARILLVDGVNGSLHMTTSDYRKFHSTSTIVGTNGVIGPDGRPLPEPK